VPLIPRQLPVVAAEPGAPLWRIAGIDWDTSVPDGVLRNDAGNRIRQKATVTVQQQRTGSAASPPKTTAERSTDPGLEPTLTSSPARSPPRRSRLGKKPTVDR
jgi:hypothetical protein